MHKVSKTQISVALPESLAQCEFADLMGTGSFSPTAEKAISNSSFLAKLIESELGEYFE